MMWRDSMSLYVNIVLTMSCIWTTIATAGTLAVNDAVASGITDSQNFALEVDGHNLVNTVHRALRCGHRVRPITAVLSRTVRHL